MSATCASRLAQFWSHLQHELFPFLREEDYWELSPTLEKVIRVLRFTQVDRFILCSRGFVGRPPKDPVALVRASVVKAALIDRLKADQALRRICGFEPFHGAPDASRFSRAFAEFAATGLDHNSVQDRALRLVMGLVEVGRISELLYPWKCKLTEGGRRCPKILPRQTLAQMPGGRHPTVPGRCAVRRREAPLAPGAGGTA